MIPLSDIAGEITKLLRFKFRPIKQPRIVWLDGKAYSKYSGAHLRKVRARNGVGRPPRRAA